MQKQLKANPAWGKSLLFEADGVTPRDEGFDAIRCRICDAIQQAIDDGQDMDLDGDSDAGMYAYVMDVFPTTAVYSLNGEMFQIPYTDDGETVTLGTPVEVEISYTVMPDDSAADATEESHRELVGELMQLKESSFDEPSGKMTMTVIKPGFNLGKGHYYPADVLKRDHKVFEGNKMFADHQTDKQEKENPGNSVHNWVATIKRIWPEADGTLRAEAAIIDPKFKAKLAELGKQGMLSDMGISIRAVAEASKGKIDGTDTTVIESLVRGRSVDFVTYAGAGGQVEAMESSVNNENDVDLVTETQLRERRPDLVELIESTAQRSKNMAEKTAEVQLQEANAQLTAEKTAREVAEAKAKKLQESLDSQAETLKTLTEKIEASELATKKAEAQTALGKLLAESKLAKMPEATRKLAYSRVTEKFVEAQDSAGMKEAIDAEWAYIQSIAPPARVKDLGAGDNGVSERKTSLKEGFMGMGMTEKEAEIAAAGRPQ